MTDVAVLLGHHIDYSASPAMHNAAFAALGIDARYELADVTPVDLADAVEALRRPDRLGANVTQPHKKAIRDLVDDVEIGAHDVEAVNTVVRVDGQLIGHNTDVEAVTAELREILEQLGRRWFGSVLVLGAGGAARAVFRAIEIIGCERLDIASRETWDSLPRDIARADVLINATPIGTASDESPVPVEGLRRDLTVLDLVYRPSPTRLVREARERGATARGGAGMLLRQAAASFELWTGRQAPTEVMRDALRTELGIAADV